MQTQQELNEQNAQLDKYEGEDPEELQAIAFSLSGSTSKVKRKYDDLVYICSLLGVVLHINILSEHYDNGWFGVSSIVGEIIDLDLEAHSKLSKKLKIWEQES